MMPRFKSTGWLWVQVLTLGSRTRHEPANGKHIGTCLKLPMEISGIEKGLFLVRFCLILE